MKSYASLQRIFTISGADMCVKQNMGEIANHFLRQKYHFEVPCGWCNDPNGFIYWNGSYHLFYQHNPFAADPEDFKMFWGHAVSNDLVHWEYVKPALAPGLTYDNAGCWSGNAGRRCCDNGRQPGNEDRQKANEEECRQGHQGHGRRY